MNKNWGRGKISKVLLAAGFVTLFAGNAFALSLNLSSHEDADITFNGSADTFTFTEDVYDFHLVGGVGITDFDTVGLMGNLSGTYAIGTITTTITPVGILQTAPVTGSGIFSIVDEAAVLFSADVEFVNVQSFESVGGLNYSSAANLTNLVYGGGNTDLQQLLQVLTISYQFTTPTSLTKLTADGTTTQNSYSGTASTVSVPEPATMLLLGTGLLGLGLIRRKKQDRG